jgi:hypothetical protein
MIVNSLRRICKLLAASGTEEEMRNMSSRYARQCGMRQEKRSGWEDKEG